MTETLGQLRKQLKPKRSGVPHTVYFSKDLAASLATTPRAQRVGKSTIIRIAVEEILTARV
jgi:hypothetical protein